MTKAKMQTTLEIAYDLIAKVHTDICLVYGKTDKHLEKASLEILRRIISLDKDLEEVK